MKGGMDAHLIGLLLVAVGVLSRPDRTGVDRQGHAQAVSYAHIVRDHGPPTPYRINKGFSSHDTSLLSSHFPSVSKQVPYSLQQSNPLSYDSRVPLAIGVPVAVPVDRPYKVTVPKPFPVEVERPYAVPVDRPYPYPVKYSVPVAVSQDSYEDKGYQTYEPQSDEQEDDYSGSNEYHD